MKLIYLIIITIALSFSSCAASLADESGSQTTPSTKEKTNKNKKRHAFIASLSAEEKSSFQNMSKKERRAFIKEKQKSKKATSTNNKDHNKKRLDAMLKSFPQETQDNIRNEIATAKKELGEDANQESLRQRIHAILQKYGVKKQKK